VLQEIIILEIENKNYELKSPIYGTIKDISISNGTFISKGQKICTIIPKSKLISEIYIASKDIATIKLDSEINLIIDSYNYNEYGSLKSKVTNISSEATIIDNKPYYTVKCEFEKEYLKLKNGFKGHLKKGMSLTSRYKIAKKNIIEIIFEKSTNWLDPNNIN